MSDIHAISYNPATFRKDYDNIKAAGEGTISYNGHSYELKIQPGKGKYITDTATNVTVEYKNRHEVKKWFGNQKILQEKFTLAKNQESTSANLETLKSIKFETLDSLINASSDEEKEAIQEKIASYKNAASELSNLVNNPKCPRSQKDEIFKEIGKIYDRHFQETYFVCQDVTLNPTTTYKQYKKDYEEISEKYKNLPNTNGNEKALKDLDYKTELLEGRLQYIEQTLNKAKLFQEILESFSPKVRDLRSKGLLAMAINETEKFIDQCKSERLLESLQEIRQEIQNKLPSSQTTSQATEQMINKNN